MRPISTRLRLIAALLWVAYLVAGTQVLQAGVSLLAEFDEEHHLVVGHSATGYELMMVHDAQDSTPSVETHRHGLARVLVRLSALDGHGDHNCRLAVLNVSSGVLREKRLGTQGALQPPLMTVQSLPWANLRLPMSESSVMRMRVAQVGMPIKLGRRCVSMQV